MSDEMMRRLAATERQRDDAEARAGSANGRVAYLERALTEAEADTKMWRSQAAGLAATLTPDVEISKTLTALKERAEAAERISAEEQARATEMELRLIASQRATAESEARAKMWRKRAGGHKQDVRERDEARAEVERLTVQLSEWATRCGAAETEARELREGRATWVVGDDGVRRLVVRRVVDEEVGNVSRSEEPGLVGYTYKLNDFWGYGYHGNPTRELAHVMSCAQRVVEMLTGVKL